MAGIQVWDTSGQLASAVTAMGLHRESAVKGPLPFVVKEIRKRLFVSAFVADKQLATFTNRPPRLSRRYCSYQLPLDLDDDQLMSEGDELLRHIANLDSEGWNKENMVTSASGLRAHMTVSVLRDEILELPLKPDSEATMKLRK